MAANSSTADAAAPSRTEELGFFAKFGVLRGASPELWLTFAIKFFNIAAYAVTNSTLKLWLSSDFGYTDKQSLGLVATWSLTMTAMTLLVGSLTDAIGLRRAFFLGTWVCIVARSIMVVASTPWVALTFGLFPLAIGEALGTPVLVAGVRRYSTTLQRSISFSLFYTIMNVGFLVASFLFDDVRKWMGEHGHVTLPLLGVTISTYRALFLVSLGFQICLLPLIYFIRDGAEATDEGLKVTPQPTRYPGASALRAIGFTIRDSAVDTVRLFIGLFKQSGFYRLLGFLILIAFLKLIFMQMYYVFPTFGIRELGDGAPVGKLWAINSILIIILVPIIGALTQRFAAYNMVILGGIISAISVFIMAAPPSLFETMAASSFARWLGHWYLGLDAAAALHPYYVMIAFFVILLSFGEAFYSPRVYEYAASIAPKGQEASYSALSYVPFLLAKVLIGTFSGFLLESYCPPPPGVRHSGTMWLFVGITASIAPLGLIFLRRFVRVHEAGRAN